MLDSLKGSLDTRAKFLLDENRGKLAQFQIGGEVIAAIPGRIDSLDSPKLRKSLSPWLAAPKLMSSRFMISSIVRGFAETKRSP